MSEKKDWSATQYLKFNTQRTRPVHDLLAQIPPWELLPGTRIFDLGCGPGNSTEAIGAKFPEAKIMGVDSSKDMLEKARVAVPRVEFVEGDLSAWKIPPGEQEIGLLFSNAVFHWLRHEHRIPTMVRLFEALKPGGVIAFQAPDNYHEPSHRLMRDTASLSQKPWSKYFSNTRIGDLADTERPDLDPIEAPSAFYNALIPFSADVNVWRTTYQHALPTARDIVEWVKGTGLQPFLNRIQGEEVKVAFLEEYERRIREVYGELGDGKVLLGYPRLFVVAVRK
ncbi:S-adenosyl-L-methionine-dependent methyltransferase [Amniculicola lignicola CBS 123094]|uniref:S-adenosyl-L-methionine-dependent methyltransferase n=1 Tax=Amniculicola lignicola CBS 123094 TaxID=1392246 RepID=A0A6A5WBT9_9PLEO|nr:S-adenosyl-L-methionine-dependent methyltransferase [Amniculicola lignicola CBS 123094]